MQPDYHASYRKISRDDHARRESSLYQIFDLDTYGHGSKAQLQYELDRLKAQAEPSADPGSTDSPQESEASYFQARGSNDASRFQTSRFQQQSSFNPDINPPLQETPRRSSWEQQVQAQESAEQFSKTEGTLERTLNDVTLDPGRVNDCYASYVRQRLLLH